MKVAGALGTALTLTAAYDFHTHANVSSKELDFLHASFLFCFLERKNMHLFVYVRVGVQTGVGRFANALFVALFLCPLFFL
jgi:hypothetical protein